MWPFGLGAEGFGRFCLRLVGFLGITASTLLRCVAGFRSRFRLFRSFIVGLGYGAAKDPKTRKL